MATPSTEHMSQYAMDELAMRIYFFAGQVHKASKARGNWDSVPEIPANRLIPDADLPQFNRMTIELADQVLRALDVAEAHGLDIGQAIVARHKFRLTREKG